MESTTPTTDYVALVLPVERCIVPAKQRIRVRDLPRIVDVIRVLAGRDFKVKYKQSILGPLWAIFQPLALLAAFLVAFRGLGHVKTGNVPYVVFALAGLSVWAYCQAALTIGVPAMVSNINIVRFTPCPRIALVFSGLISSLPSFAFPAAAAVVGAALTGDLSPRALLLPVMAAWILLVTASAVAFLSAWAVRYRDINSMLPFLLQLGSFVAPIGYAVQSMSGTVRFLVELNPVTGVIEVTRWVIITGYQPAMTAVYLSIVTSTLILAIGWHTFATHEPTMADEI